MTEVSDVVSQTIGKSIKEASPKLDEIVMIDVLYHEGGKWNTIEVTWKEYLAALRNGCLTDGTGGAVDVKLVAICVNEVNIDLEDGSTEKIRMIYDFVLKHSERDPWRLA